MSNREKANGEHFVHCLFQCIAGGHKVKEVKSNFNTVETALTEL